jgi:choline dehydrogenase
MGSIDEKSFKLIANYETKTFRAFFPLHANSSQEGFIGLNTCYLPESRGSVKLNSNDIHSDPIIDPDYLKHKKDVECMRKSVKMLVKLVSTKMFRQLDAKIHWPKLKQCNNFGPFGDEQNPSENYIDCLIGHGSLTAHHPHGTSSIGKVVDDDLR